MSINNRYVKYTIILVLKIKHFKNKCTHKTLKINAIYQLKKQKIFNFYSKKHVFINSKTILQRVYKKYTLHCLDILSDTIFMSTHSFVQISPYLHHASARRNLVCGEVIASLWGECSIFPEFTWKK